MLSSQGRETKGPIEESAAPLYICTNHVASGRTKNEDDRATFSA